jgi:hypothetical protein
MTHKEKPDARGHRIRRCRSASLSILQALDGVTRPTLMVRPAPK